MASDTDVQFVIDNIESDYEDHDWTDVIIADRLDAGASTSRVVATYWRKRATETIELVNISESGSSRSLDAIYARMNTLAEFWDGKATLIESPPEQANTARLATFPIKRV